MPAGVFVLAAFVFGFAVRADTLAPRGAPSYSGNSIVNAADNQPGPLAPNTIATIYGTDLAYTTKALSSGDIRGGLLPTVLSGTGVTVLVGGIPASIYFVSPNQINFLIPSILIPGPSDVQTTLDGRAGPSVPITIAASAPALFQLDAQNVIATRPDGSVVTATNPAKGGDTVVLYATGLGQVVPPLRDREIPTTALKLKQFSDLKITVAGAQIGADSILYAGVSPGFGGLYQINVKLPDTLAANPEIRVGLVDQISPAGLLLPVQSTQVSASPGQAQSRVLRLQRAGAF